MNLDINEYNEYAALADNIKIEDITTNKENQITLQRLKDNDPNFTTLEFIRSAERFHFNLNEDYTTVFIPSSAKELAWLGYFLGQNTTIDHLSITCTPPPSCNLGIEIFRTGLGQNKLIQLVGFDNVDLSDGIILQMVDTFFKNNHSLTKVESRGVHLGAQGVRQLSLAIGSCGKSLKRFSFQGPLIGDGLALDIITAMSMHPQLEELRFNGNFIGSNEYTALSTLLRCTTTQLQKLDLRRSEIDDEGIEALVNTLNNGNSLQDLNLSFNQLITLNGWKKVATLLEMPYCKLERLDMMGHNIGDEGVLAFVNALVNNSTLKTLNLEHNDITVESLAPFSKLLCDTSSVNKTYMSNHTLEAIRVEGRLPDIAAASLKLNGSRGYKVAMIKITSYHSHFNMEPFFELEIKVLPLMVKWFTNAGVHCLAFDRNKVSRMKLSALYDFIKEFPMLYIEPVTRNEIEECTIMEEELLQGDRVEQKVKLEEIRQLKARAMRRLGMK